MGDLAVDRWKLQGTLYIWHFPHATKRQQDGWHLNADALACQSIAEVIDLMLCAQWKTRRTIKLTIPKENLHMSGREWKFPSEFLLAYPKDEVEPDFWHLELRRDDVLVLTLGQEKMKEMRESLLGLPDWKDDFALGPCVRDASDQSRWNDECLWFWTRI